MFTQVIYNFFFNFYQIPRITDSFLKKYCKPVLCIGKNRNKGKIGKKKR